MHCVLSNRGVLKITGKDSAAFLQGLISNDINKASSTTFIYAMLLSPQGRFLYDFFILKILDGYLLDCPKDSVQEIIKKLQMYKLRSEVTVEDLSDSYSVLASNKQLNNYYIDPRTELIGYRAILQNQGNASSDMSEYEIKRIKNLLPDAEKDFIYNKSFPLEYGANNLNAIDYKKGCYVGQEVTARTNYRGVVRKKLLSFSSKQPIEKGIEIRDKENKIGTTLGMFRDYGLCLLNIEDYEKCSMTKPTFLAGEIKITIKDASI